MPRTDVIGEDRRACFMDELLDDHDIVTLYIYKYRQQASNTWMETRRTVKYFKGPRVFW